MTEDEAKTKWCFAFTASHTDPRAEISEWDKENGQTGPFVHACIASACMAWRWTGYRAANGTWVRRVVEAPWDPEKADGYCGLAGQSQ